MTVEIVIATMHDTYKIASMALKMWKGSSIEKLTRDFNKIICSDDGVIFIAQLDDSPIGFAQCQLRHDYVEGTHNSPVGYLEGIFVEKEHRNRGYAKYLLEECENWLKSKGCCEFASDCELNNEGSRQFHLKSGFSEANHIICFTKEI